MVHLDPPFGSAAGYTRRRKLKGRSASVDLQLPAYSDVDGGDVAAYLEGLYPVLCRARDILAPHGSFYLHIDFRRSAHLRLLLDEVFGADCLVNEIVWAYALGGSTSRRFQRKHDTILLYARTPGEHYFAAPKEAATSSMLAGRPKLATDTWVTTGTDDDAPILRDWPDELVSKTLSNRDPERTGYGTQKPLALALRMVSASCPPGGLVVDPMCGSGTIGAAAVRLGRSCVLGDRGAPARDVTRSRLLAAGARLDVGEHGGDRALTVWQGRAPIVVHAGRATLVHDALEPLFGGLDGAARELLSGEPLLAVGAWGIGKRADDGALDLIAFTDGARQREHVPVADTLPTGGEAADAGWLCDVAGNMWVCPLTNI